MELGAREKSFRRKACRTKKQFVTLQKNSMALKEKFKEILTAFWINDWEDECEKIADEFAIEFIDWYRKIASILDSKYINKSTKELLEIYKKEKGL
jgi:hypothetical protein